MEELHSISSVLISARTVIDRKESRAQYHKMPYCIAGTDLISESTSLTQIIILKRELKLMTEETRAIPSLLELKLKSDYAIRQY